MASLIYKIGVLALGTYLQLSEILGNEKSKRGNIGRKKWKQNLAGLDTKKKTFWIHAASHGEAIMAMPLIEQIFKTPNHQLVMSFFSPSGYENFNYKNKFFFKCYLPLDFKRNSKQIIDFINPKILIFVKYDLWLNLINECHKKEISTIIISSKFREQQWYFKFKAKKPIKILKSISKIFTLDKASENLLKSKGFKNMLYSGDTRYDQVLQESNLSKIQDLKIDHNCIILGSSWEKEEELVAEIVDEMGDVKWIIAPHEIDEKKLKTLQSKFNVSCSLFSEIDYNKPIPRILIIDQIGLLADLYSFSEIAFIGGGFSGQLHNILEAGAKGNVILFGPKIEKYPEAKFLYEENVGYKINDSLALKTVIYELLNNKNTLRAKQKKVIEIINNQKGATKIIWNEIKKLI